MEARGDGCMEMKSFHQFISEAFARADLDKLRTDGYAFTKNTRRISTPQELAIVTEAFRVWQQYARELIYNRLIGMKDNGDSNVGSADESYSSRKLRETAWQVVSVFDFLGDVRGTSLDDLKVGRQFAYTPKTAVWWDIAYRDWAPRRDAQYSRLQRIMKAMFDALDEYIQYDRANASTIPDRHVVTQLNVAGVPVLVSNSEVNDRADRIKPMLRFIEQAVAAVRQKGLGQAVARLRIQLDLGEHDDTAGTWNHNDSITIKAWADMSTYTIAHEIGHAYYYRAMTGYQRQRWEQFIRDHKTSFTDHDIMVLHDAYLKAFDALKDRAQGYTVDVWPVLNQFCDDEDTATKYIHFMAMQRGKTFRTRLLFDPYKDGSDLQAKFDEFRKAAAGTFLLDAPTDYSNKNESEAYAEVFAFYVLDKGPLAPVMRTMFRECSGL